MTRRVAACLLVAALGAAACGGGGSSGSGGGAAASKGLAAEVASFDLAVGPAARFIVGLLTNDQEFVSYGSVHLRFTYEGRGEKGARSRPGRVQSAWRYEWNGSRESFSVLDPGRSPPRETPPRPSVSRHR